MNSFTYNGQSSQELGIFIKAKTVFSAGKRDLTLVSIPGRDGDLVSSNGRYQNGTVSYQCFASAPTQEALATKMRNVRKWLYSEPDSYHWLSDTYEPGFLRKAVFNAKLDVTDQLRRVAQFTVSFSVHPMRYLGSGLDPVSVSNGGTLYNPYPFASKPYLKISGSGSGTLTIQRGTQSKTWSFTGISGYVECDSELMNFYKDSVLKNSTVTGEGYPELLPGESEITFAGGITGVQITPRWWCA